jgi:hypothetical protein
VLLFLALASMAADRAPDAVERKLMEKCGVEVPRSASMTYAGDLWRVLYDDNLPPDKIQCIEAWAKGWPKSGGILAYPKSRFVIPEHYRAR